MSVGIFHTPCRILSLDRSKTVTLPRLLVDTGAEATWVPAAQLERLGIKREKKGVHFEMANGEVVRRNIGYAIIRLGRYETVDEVVFAESGDHSLLGARTMEGLNLVVDPRRKNLVAAGPILTA